MRLRFPTSRPLRWALLLLPIGLLSVAAGCADGAGAKPCERDLDCPDGYCDTFAGRCVEGQKQCETDVDCGGVDRICESFICIPSCQQVGCIMGENCNLLTGRCRLLKSCQIDSQCAPPESICVDGICEPGCSITGCQAGLCDPYSGQCQGGVGCSSDGDCAPPATVCESRACLPGCTAGSCGAGLSCNLSTGRCQPEAGCLTDGDCSPPSTVCESPNCVAGCSAGSCPGGEQCNQSTGRCQATSLALDGEVCTQNTDCLSELCIDAIVANVPYRFCSRPCCTEYDCGSNQACLYHRGTKLCIPDRIYPAGYSFTAQAGASCGGGGPSCRSGFCNHFYSECARTCCESSDCGGYACVFFFDTDTDHMFELCADPGGLAVGRTGAPCVTEYDCQSLTCLTGLGVCADMCCTNSDCPVGYLCSQILGPSGTPVATTVCVPGNPGVGTDGTACTPGDAPTSQCSSGLCAGGACREPCCQDFDCAGAQICQALPSGLDLNNDGQSDWVRACVN